MVLAYLRQILILVAVARLSIYVVMGYKKLVPLLHKKISPLGLLHKYLKNPFPCQKQSYHISLVPQSDHQAEFVW
ncbi:Uncharacterised protein [Citrobacter werkmanii]|nr:Uncharacterised protein [Citrobacter werkmanii]